MTLPARTDPGRLLHGGVLREAERGEQIDRLRPAGRLRGIGSKVLEP